MATEPLEQNLALKNKTVNNNNHKIKK